MQTSATVTLTTTKKTRAQPARYQHLKVQNSDLDSEAARAHRAPRPVGLGAMGSGSGTLLGESEYGRGGASDLPTELDNRATRIARGRVAAGAGAGDGTGEMKTPLTSVAVRGAEAAASARRVSTGSGICQLLEKYEYGCGDLELDSQALVNLRSSVDTGGAGGAGDGTDARDSTTSAAEAPSGFAADAKPDLQF